MRPAALITTFLCDGLLDELQAGEILRIDESDRPRLIIEDNQVIHAVLPLDF